MDNNSKAVALVYTSHSNNNVEARYNLNEGECLVVFGLLRILVLFVGQWIFNSHWSTIVEVAYQI